MASSTFSILPTKANLVTRPQPMHPRQVLPARNRPQPRPPVEQPPAVPAPADEPTNDRPAAKGEESGDDVPSEDSVGDEPVDEPATDPTEAEVDGA